MPVSIWSKLHGAATHFPIALVICAAVFDAAGLLSARKPSAAGLHLAAYWAMLFAAFGSVAAVGSGLVLSRGVVLGHGLLRWHHLFVWPAFALIVGAATWRTIAGVQPGPRGLCGYLAVLGIAAGLVTGAAYSGGELLLRG
jgi:uncharacterized membrane protein